MVSVCVLSYNHEKYLRDCLEGIVMQRTTFPIEAWVHDDASTDKSQEIIKEYQQRYPEIIKPILQTENQYSKKEGSILAMHLYPKCTGKYVALCEGDDYWIDPNKLQKQVDYMESHPDVGLCYTDYDRRYDCSDNISHAMFEQQHQYRPASYEQHLLKPGYLAPMTWVYRRVLCNLFAKVELFSDGTYAYMMEAMQHYPVVYLPITTATYRVHMGSASAPTNAKSMFNYMNGVFRTQRYFINKYPCSEEMKNKVLMRGYLEVLPIAISADQNDFINEAQSYMASQDMDIHLIIRDLQQGEMRRRSKAYRLGKALLKPFKRIKG